MPFWKKTKEDEEAPAHVAEAHRLSEALARLEGTLACSEKTCTADNGVPCQYVDRRNRSCRSAWCPEHRIIMDGQVFCRRHAGIVSALPGGTTSASPLPDLENRAPSLVSWVARELDADIRSLLLDAVDPPGGAQLIADPVCLIFLGADRRRAWERTWKLASHRGNTLRVALQVEEASDSEVIAKVGLNEVDRAVPPWIMQRRHKSPSTPDEDAARRQEYSRRLLDAIVAGVARERQLMQSSEQNEKMLREIYGHRSG